MPPEPLVSAANEYTPSPCYRRTGDRHLPQRGDGHQNSPTADAGETGPWPTDQHQPDCIPTGPPDPKAQPPLASGSCVHAGPRSGVMATGSLCKRDDLLHGSIPIDAAAYWPSAVGHERPQNACRPAQQDQQSVLVAIARGHLGMGCVSIFRHQNPKHSSPFQ